MYPPEPILVNPLSDDLYENVDQIFNTACPPPSKFWKKYSTLQFLISPCPKTNESRSETSDVDRKEKKET